MKKLLKTVSVILAVVMLLACVQITAPSSPVTVLEAAAASTAQEPINETFSGSIQDLVNSGLFSGVINSKSTHLDMGDETYNPSVITDANLTDLFEITNEGTLKLKSSAPEGAALKLNLPAAYVNEAGATATLEFKYKASALPASGNMFTVRADSSSNAYRGPAATLVQDSTGFRAVASGTLESEAKTVSYTPGEWVTVSIAFAYGSNTWAPTFVDSRVRIDGRSLSDIQRELSTRGGGVTSIEDLFLGIGGNWAGQTFEIDNLKFTAAGGSLPTISPTTAPTTKPSATPKPTPTPVPTPIVKPTVQPGGGFTVEEDRVLWSDTFEFGSSISPSAGAANRWNRIYAGSATVIADPGDSSNGVGQFTADASGKTSASTLNVTKGYLPFEKEFILSSRFMIPQPAAGNPAPVTFEVASNTIMTMTYDSSAKKYRWTIGSQSGYYEIGKWIKINILVTPNASAKTTAEQWINCNAQVTVTGNLQNANGASVNKIVENLKVSFNYQQSTWGAGMNGVTYDVEITAPAGGKASFCLDDVRFYEPVSLQLLSVTPDMYGDAYGNVKLNGKVVLLFNHDLDNAVFNAGMVSVEDYKGNKKSANVIFDASRPDRVVLDFSSSPLSQYMWYNIILNSNIADVTGRKINNVVTKSFETKGASGATPSPMPISTPPAGGYVMPDKYNTGHITPRAELVDINVKYPEFTTTGKRVITEEIAKKYNYVFEGFSLTSGSIEVKAPNVTIRDFYLYTDAYTGIESNDMNLLVEDGELEGTKSVTIYGRGITMKRLYIHDVGADHLKPVSDNYIESCYLADGGSWSHLAHADGMQFSGEREHYTNNIKILGNRIDMPPLPLTYLSNAALFCSLNFGDSRNVQMSYNWLNGGGFTTYVSAGDFSHTKITLTNNYFGVGKRYGYYTIDSAFNEGGRLAGELTMENNIILEDEDVASAGSVVYSGADSKRIYDLADLKGSEMTVMVNLANYTTREQNIRVVAELVKNGTAEKTETLNTTVNRYTPTSEYLVADNIRYETLPNEQGVSTKYETLINIPDLPRNVEKVLTFTNLPSDLAGYSVRVKVYSGSNANALKEIRSDVLINSIEDTTPDVIYGDVTGDGKINALDRANISRYIAKWDNYNTINETAADVNMDSRVNALDRAFVSRYIAKWDGYEFF